MRNNLTDLVIAVVIMCDEEHLYSPVNDLMFAAHREINASAYAMSSFSSKTVFEHDSPVAAVGCQLQVLNLVPLLQF